MIVQPDFLDHWKTLRLASVLNDQLAPVYVIRLWSYVQTRRCDLIPDDAETVKAICRWSGCPDLLHKSLLECGWLEKHDDGLLVHGWSDLNARLIHNWTAGATGGRPRVPIKKPKGKPKGLSNETDRIGLDGIRLDQHLPPVGGVRAPVVPETPPAKTPRPRNLVMDALASADGDPLQITDWAKVAKALQRIRTVAPNVTPKEIANRIANYRTHFPECACTSTAVAAHWAKCDKAAEPSAQSSRFPIRQPDAPSAEENDAKCKAIIAKLRREGRLTNVPKIETGELPYAASN